MVLVVMHDCSRECVPYNRHHLDHSWGCVPYDSHHFLGNLLLHQNLDFHDYDSDLRFLAHVALFLFFLVSMVHD